MKFPIIQFSEMTQKHLNKIAVCDEKKVLTYAELDARSNRIAQYLLHSGIRKGSRVGILGPRSTCYVERILAILKIGAVYVPLDPEYPSDRIQTMIEASSLELILDDFNQSFEMFSSMPVSAEMNLKDTVVILFTSGSTGKPKGVELNYEGYLNNFINMQKLLQFDDNTRIAQMASPCFDISVTELWMPLMFGSTIFIACDAIKKNPWLLADWIAEKQIDTIQFVPSLFHHFLLAHAEEPVRLASVKKLLFIGEALRSSLINTWFASFSSKECTVFNLYGPVEASIEVSSFTITTETPLAHEIVPIGIPFEGIKFHLKDANGNWINVPGKEGMLYIEGVQLAKGYLNKEQTERAFTQASFGRVYETGDIAEMLPNGHYLFRGRKDRQIKIRGYRVELAEIEAALMSCTGVKKSAVVATETTEGVYKLTGLLTGDLSSNLTVKQELSTKLPGYMVPHQLKVLSEMPLNSNGKTDYKALLHYV